LIRPATGALGLRTLLAINALTEAVQIVVPVLTHDVVTIGAAYALGGLGIALWNVGTVTMRQRIAPAAADPGAGPTRGSGVRVPSAPPKHQAAASRIHIPGAEPADAERHPSQGRTDERWTPTHGLVGHAPPIHGEA
jgi:hypothetical protein